MYYSDINAAFDLYLGEVSIANNKRVDLIVIDLQELFVYKPSIFKLETTSGLSILDMLGFSNTVDMLDILDSNILSRIIDFILCSDYTDIFAVIENIVDEVSERLCVTHSFDKEHLNKKHLAFYLVELTAALDKILSQYVIGYSKVLDGDILSVMPITNKYYSVHTVTTLFGKKGINLFITIKLYSDRIPR